jgi:hypothetical protein
MMGKKIFTLLLLFSGCLVYSQKTVPGSFTLTNNQHPENEAFYITSIEKADMEKFRLKDKEVTIEFENGFTCVMLPAKELFISGKNVNPLNYQEGFSRNFVMPVFNVMPDGHLTAVHKKYNPKAKSTGTK